MEPEEVAFGSAHAEPSRPAEDASQQSYFGDGLVKDASLIEEVAAPQPSAPKIISRLAKEKTAGPSATLTLQQAVSIAVTPRSFLSHRIAPPLTICRGRIFAGDELIASTDIVVAECCERLTRVAHGFGVTLDLRYDTGEDVVWSSDTPDLWYGVNPLFGGGRPVPLADLLGQLNSLSESIKDLRPAPAPAPKAVRAAKAVSGPVAKVVKMAPRRIGRPPGSKDKSPRKITKRRAYGKKAAASRKQTGKKARIGRPPGAKDKKPRKRST